MEGLRPPHKGQEKKPSFMLPEQGEKGVKHGCEEDFDDRW
jgi:hypothetical protein